MPTGEPGSGEGAKEGRGLIAPGRTATSPAKDLRNEQIVMFVLANPDLTYNQIGLVFGMSGENVRVIVKSNEGKEIITQARRRLREKLLESAEEQLDLQAKLAVKALQRTLEADISPTHKAKANQDRVATKVLQGRGLLKSGPDSGNKGGYQMSPEMFDRLERALSKADMAAGIDPFEGKPVIEGVIEEEKDDGRNEERKESVA
jgi:hypothetical protein